MLQSFNMITAGGSHVTVTDLATHPSTGVVYGFEAGTGFLMTIDTLTGTVVKLGNNGFSSWGGLAFAQDGTLYHVSSTVANPQFLTLDPATGAATSQLTYGPDTGCDGLVVRPSDGALLATRGTFAGGDAIVMVDKVTGATSIIGNTGVGTCSDLSYDSGLCQLDLGMGGPGSSTLSVCGQDLITTGNTATLLIDTPLPTTLAVLVVGPGFNPIPLYGGTLVPSGAPLIFTNYVTDPSGDVTFPISATGVTPVVLYAQVGALDLTQPQLVQFTNAIQITILL